jgi:hypothetical protein
MALQESAAAGIARWIPAVDWFRHYRRDWLGRDLLAGITAGAVVIPQAMGYATVAGLPVQMGSPPAWSRSWCMPCSVVPDG